jgi:hypothetical protein
VQYSPESNEHTNLMGTLYKQKENLCSVYYNSVPLSLGAVKEMYSSAFNRKKIINIINFGLI